jgi:hypothetical protein
VQGASCPCIFWHSERDILTSVHGDDFTSRGPKVELDWLVQQLGEKYELKEGPRLGPGSGDAKQASVLNRIVHWSDDGVWCEADPRQAERLVSECGLDGAKSVCTPGIRESAAEVAADSELEPRLLRAFRAAAARANYLAQDRPDCQFASKEICRFMAKPSQASWHALKRLCRYLVGLPRLIWRFQWQEDEGITVYSDTDWAGCPRTRKSTSGGCIMTGRHLLKSWSSTQSSVALSSGEAEFYGVVKASGYGLAYQALLKDFGMEKPLTVYTDSTAAMGIASRQGLGKLRHLETTTLWVQQAVRCKRLTLRKVLGDENPADVFTKHIVGSEKLGALMRLYDCKYMSGRAESAPQLRTEQRGKSELRDAEEGELNMLMPHAFTGRDLENRYPKATAIDDQYEDFDDTLMHGQDYLNWYGEQLGMGIMATATALGRRKHQPEGPRPGDEAVQHSHELPQPREHRG